MMGLAIAHESRNQVTFYNEPIIVKEETKFTIEAQEDYDFGEQIVVV